MCLFLSVYLCLCVCVSLCACLSVCVSEVGAVLERLATSNYEDITTGSVTSKS